MEVVAEDDDGALVGVELAQGPIDEAPVREPPGRVVRREVIEGGQLHLDDPSSSASSDVETGADGQPMEPGVEPLGVAQTREVPPGGHHRLLDRVARELRVPEDESGRQLQPRDGPVDEQAEGVMIAPTGPFHETALVHGRPSVRCDDLRRTHPV